MRQVLSAILMFLLCGCGYSQTAKYSFANSSESMTLSSSVGVLNYYIAPGGSDSNDGSASHPWATFAHADVALSLGSGGSTVHVASGTYSGATLKQSGTASARIRYVSDSHWGAKLTSTLLVAGRYTDIVGFDVSCPYCWSGIQLGYGPTSYPTGGNYDRVLRNYVHDVGQTTGNPVGCPAAGAIISMRDADHVVIDGNTVKDIGSYRPCTEEHGIYVGGPYTTVTNNVVSNAVGWGIQVNQNTCREVVANNTVFHNYWGGIVITAGFDYQATGICNYVDDYTSVNNNISVNNGIDSNHNGIEEYSTRVGPHNAYNNNFQAGNGFQGTQNNVYILGGGTQSANLSQNSVSGLFLNYQDNGSGNYRLQSGSRAIQAGTTGKCTSSPGMSPCEPSYDHDGGLRGSGNDIGAYQKNATPGTWLFY